MRSAPASPPPLPFSVLAPPYPPPGYPPPPPCSHGGNFDGNYSILDLIACSSSASSFIQVTCFSIVLYNVGWAVVHKYLPGFGPKMRFRVGTTIQLVAQQFGYRSFRVMELD